MKTIIICVYDRYFLCKHNAWGDIVLDKNKETFGLKVEKAIIDSSRLDSQERIQYYITDDDIPIYEVNRWLERVSFNSYLTGKSYAYSLLNYLRFLKAKKIHYHQVENQTVIDNYIKYLLYGDSDVASLEGKMSLNSIKQRLAVLKNFYEWLEDNRSVSNNVVTANKKSKGNKKQLKSKFLYGQIWDFDVEKSISSHLNYKQEQHHIKWYKKEEIEKLLFVLPTNRDKLIFKISIESGMRIGEILGLKLEHLDFFEGTLMVRKSENNENETRAKTFERDLYISEQLCDEISDYIKGERAEADILFSDYLFINHKGVAKGKATRTRNFLSIFKRAGKKVGFDTSELRTHSGRSTHAQQLLDALHEGEISEVYILQQMGWSNINTLKNYTRSYQEKSRLKIARSMNEKHFNLPSIKGDANDEK